MSRADSAEDRDNSKLPGSATHELIDEILNQVALGHSLAKTCKKLGVKRPTVMRWFAQDIAGSADRYARAREFQADSHADMIIDACKDVLAGELPPDQARVAIDGYKWAASKLKPNTYGDRVEHRLTASDGLLGALQSIERRVKDVTPKPAMIEHEPSEDSPGEGKSG